MSGKATETPIIETRGLVRRFGSFVAVAGVDLHVARNTVHALIGPNGAGKTTVFNLVSKFLDPSEGQILYDGRDITRAKPAEVARQGMVRSFQISAIFGRMTVAENVRIALQRPTGLSFAFWRRDSALDHLDARVDTLLEAVGLLDWRDRPASGLPYGRKRALEFATTLALDPQLMLLDEPMAGLGQEDVARISALIVGETHKRSILMVEHNLSVVAELADRITVLARGEILAEGDYATIAADRAVIEAYIGDDID